jgi:hypothetical protein
LIAIFVFLAGCATNKGVDYYWGNYSITLFAYKKEPSPETEQSHMEQLQKIIDKSAEKNYRVPPGVQAELGNMYAKRGNTEAARALFEGELAAYPESGLFIEKLQRMLDE